MDKRFKDFLLLDLQQNSGGIDMLSKAYLYEKKYAQHRSQVVLIGGPLVHRSRLSILLREGMTEERRRNIFPGDFDLGNMRTLPTELCTYEKLADELYGKGREAIEANDAFETIQKTIHCITGRKMQGHFKVNKSTALKVIRTLNLMVRQRYPRLMQLLIPPVPGKKFSMSFRDSYPYEKNQEQVWLIADLKAYLSVELSDKRFQEIGLTFSFLHELMNNIIWNVEKILVGTYRASYKAMIVAYVILATVVKEYQIQHEPKDVPLDEELFIHLHTLEFAHFAVGYPELIRIAIPQHPITPVLEELRTLAKKAFPQFTDRSERVRSTDPDQQYSGIFLSLAG